MIEISNRHFELLIEKLPRLLDMVRKGQPPTTLRQQEDLRQIWLLHGQLKKKRSKQIKNHNNDKKRNRQGTG